MAPPLLIRLTRISPTHHRLAIVRADGSAETRDLETRSTLRHDLVHFAVETEAGLSRSFWGLLARGVAYAELTMAGSAAGSKGEIADTERVVGALQGMLATGREPAAFVAAFAEGLRSMDASPPSWLTAELVVRVRERMRRLEGQWRATPFGQAMELRFELPD
jgi:hypothetical protein